MKLLIRVSLVLILICISLPNKVIGQEYTLPGGMDNLRIKLNYAISDYNEAISGCNGALRDSAERQIERIQSEISKSKDGIKGIYDKTVKRLSEIYSELTQYIDKPNELKSMFDTIVGAIPVIGTAYSGANTITDLVNKHANQDNVADVLSRVNVQLQGIGEVSQEYDKWAKFGDEVAKRLDSLRKRFRKDCRGKELGTWRYDDPATVDQAGVADVSVSGKDRASGNIFEGNVKNNTGDIVTVYFPLGGWIIPDDPSFQRMILSKGWRITVPPGGKAKAPLSGFCADPRKYPPPAGKSGVYIPPTQPGVFIPDGNPFNQEFARLPFIPEIVERLIKEGKISPTGLPPEMERITLIQWLIWNVVENFNPDDSKEKIEEQVKKSGGSQTPEQIEKLNKNIWEGIDLVKKEIKK